MPAASDENAEPARLGALGFAGTAAQLALLLAAVRVHGLEEPFGLVAVTPVVFLGFCVHAWLPRALKPPAFLAVSLVAFVVVLGAADAARVAGIALALFGICHLPVRVALRALLLVAAGAGLAVLRAGWIETSWARVVLPVVAAMFMFRGAVYLYDLRTEQRTGTAPASIWMRLAYFFLLPNVCFLLFPVVDYRTFRRTYYERPAGEIHQRGIHWILRGVVHLLLYRVVYAYLIPDLPEIRDVVGVAAFVVSSYLLFLRVSGHFHLIVGILHLFGFHLPETNRDWLLASSFTDTWRRINVYWTELMKKLVYYPTFVRLRRPGRRGLLPAVVGATAATFLATWLLHAYQWFWLAGSLPAATDGLFWGAAGALALGTMLWEARRGAPRTLGRRVPSWGSALRRSAQTFTVFAAICIVWSLWCTSSLHEWLSLLARAGEGSRAQYAALLGGALGVVAAGTVAQRLAATVRLPSRLAGERGAPLRAVLTAAAALLVLLPGLAPVQRALGPAVTAALGPLTQDFVNRRDRERRVAGYYDRLIDREGMLGRVWEQARLDPNDPELFLESPLAARVDPPLLWELAPNRSVEFVGAVVGTNRWGMRDRDYERAKPAGTYRIAVLGTCYEMGLGVNDDEVWEALAEERLNRELAPRTGLRYEVLNFSVPGYTLVHQVALMRAQVAGFEPDLVVLTNHVVPSLKYMVQFAPDRSTWPAGLAAHFEGRDVAPARWEAEIERWAFGAIEDECERLGATPALLEVPFLDYARGRVEAAAAERRLAEQADAAHAQGFELLDIAAAFEGVRREEVALPRLPHCPGPRGQRLMAERFYEALRGLPGPLGTP